MESNLSINADTLIFVAAQGEGFFKLIHQNQVILAVFCAGRVGIGRQHFQRVGGGGEDVNFPAGALQRHRQPGAHER